MFRIIFFLFLFFHGSLSLALINMRNGSFNDTWIDIIQTSDSGYDMKIERTYSSRSLFIGLFGFGWCSFIETELEVLSTGELIFKDCGGGKEVTFYPTRFDPISPKNTAQLILDATTKESRSISAADRGISKQELINNSILRFQLAKRFHILQDKDIRNKKNTFYSSSSRLSFITFDGQNYTYSTDEGERFVFDSQGYLIRHFDRAGNSILLQYKNKKLFSVTDDKGRQFQLTYDASGRLQSIHNGARLKATYKFRGEDLAEVTNAWQNTYFFKYDDRHNLSSILFPGGSQIQVQYNGEKDWITFYKNRIQCKESYNYEFSRKNPKNHYWSLVNQDCPSSKTDGKFEYLYQAATNRQVGKYLRQLNSRIGPKIKNADFHPTLGEIIKLKKNSSFEQYTYDDLGVKRGQSTQIFDANGKISQIRNESYTYSNNRKSIIKATREESLPGRAQRSIANVNYTYDKKGLLKMAQSSQGQSINVGWDTKGYLSRLSDPKLGTLRFQYGDSGSKPERITHDALGTIIIEYTPSGDILKVKGLGKKSQPKKVVQTLIQFVKPIGPVIDDLDF